jgi:DNA ligase-1
MSQRTITSFFTRTNQKAETKDDKNKSNETIAETKELSDKKQDKSKGKAAKKTSVSRKSLSTARAKKDKNEQNEKRKRLANDAKKSPAAKKIKTSSLTKKDKENRKKEKSDASHASDDTSSDNDMSNKTFTRIKNTKKESAIFNRIQNIVDSDTSSDEEKDASPGKRKKAKESKDSKDSAASKKTKHHEDSSPDKNNAIINDIEVNDTDQSMESETTLHKDNDDAQERKNPKNNTNQSKTFKKLQHFTYNDDKSDENDFENPFHGESLSNDKDKKNILNKNYSSPKNANVKIENEVVKTPISNKLKKVIAKDETSDEDENMVNNKQGIKSKTEKSPSLKKEESKSPKEKNNIGNKEKNQNITKESPPSKQAISNGNTMIGNNKEVNKDINYDPSLSSYHPINDAFWKKEQKVPYMALTRTFELIDGISARLKIVEILSNFFRSVIVLSPNDLLPSIYLCLNQLAPAYEGLELGIAETNLMKAIASSTGRTLAQIKAELQKVGDLGK